MNNTLGCTRGYSLLSEEQVQEILDLRHADLKKWTQKALAEKFGVSELTIVRVLSGTYTIRKPRHPRMTEEQVLAAHAEHQAGKTIAEVARTLGVLKTSLVFAFKRRNLPYRTRRILSDEEVWLAYKEWVAHGSIQMVCKKYGACPHTLQDRWKQLCIDVEDRRGVLAVAPDLGDRPIPAWKLADERRRKEKMY